MSAWSQPSLLLSSRPEKELALKKWLLGSNTQGADFWHPHMCTHMNSLSYKHMPPTHKQLAKRNGLLRFTTPEDSSRRVSCCFGLLVAWWVRVGDTRQRKIVCVKEARKQESQSSNSALKACPRDLTFHNAPLRGSSPSPSNTGGETKPDRHKSLGDI